MANKRKRDALSDSDSDEVTPGKQILPVAHLPDDFDQEPQDGLQYLFLVRRDARRLPHVTRARNPYEVSEAEVGHTSTPVFANDLPCEEWRVAFQAHFSNLRKNLAQTTVHDHPDSRWRAIPEKKDRDAWWQFLAGYPESTWGPRDRSTRKKASTSRRMRAFAHSAEQTTEAVLPEDATRPLVMPSNDEPCHLPTACLVDSSGNIPSTVECFPSVRSTNTAPFAADLASEGAPEKHTGELLPPEVTPGHLREIDHRMSIHLLMYFAHWINVHLQSPSDPRTTISVGHGQWMFALLTRIDDRLSADEMNLLRNLARACLGLVRVHRGVTSHPAFMSDASCWMVFAAIAGFWGQRDLWTEASA